MGLRTLKFMTAKIVNTLKETFPASRFIGRRYTDADRLDGSFGAKWGEWFENNLFEKLESLESLPENGDAFIGAMRVKDGIFEYWIGMFLPAGTEVPDGYEYADIESIDYGVLWLYGNQHNGQLYGMDNHNMCLAEIEKLGWLRKEDDWCFERYNCPRFTTPDDQGNVILDYGIAIEG